MKIYTRTGDAGITSNLYGQRVSKNDMSMHLIGAADELNSHLGLIKAMLSNVDIRRFIEGIQINLMKLMAHVSDIDNNKYLFSSDEVEVLEREIDKLSRGETSGPGMEPEKTNKRFELVLPGKNMTEAQIHIARTVARRAERLFFAVNEKKPLCKIAGAYLNRLSDYLFVLSQSGI
ncbi:MAG: cob(I)yrinic acid a,c-diamide adenosyltransferase [Treponema sp.]|nr:cob(I)yrinic acid a,c-diamide adenosyltransferase [Treponema sp.]